MIIPYVVLTSFVAANASATPPVIPFVKQWTPAAGHLDLKHATIDATRPDLDDERNTLRQSLEKHGIQIGPDGQSIRLEITRIALPPIASRYAQEIRDQAYGLNIHPTGIHITAHTPAGVFYAVQTLDQLLQSDKPLACGTIIDWPDLAYRGIMVDPARANENADYYKRLIRFCGRHKLNRLHIHLTDDQNVCLHHDDYGPLLHPHAWRPYQLAPLVDLAARHHIELIPEIESLGHARVFTRHPDFRDILHQTATDKPEGSWSGTSIPGFTNVLCPASDKTYEYLRKMYAASSSIFPYPETHIGCDEVDMTECKRCDTRYPGLSHSEWFLKHLLRCRDLVARHDRRTALWGDMLLRHRDIVDRIPTDNTIIYDWHYRPSVSGDSVAFFKSRGFEVVACPALMCYPHMILPALDSHENIRRFTALARTHDIVGVNTTIWIPTRYMSDVLWPGIGWAATHAWSGRQFDDAAFYRRFMRDFFDSPDGDAFAVAWQDLTRIDWPLQQVRTSCWFDEKSLAAARKEAAGPAGDHARRHLADLRRTRDALARLRGTIRCNRVAWDAIEQSAAILACVLEHFLAATDLVPDGQRNKDRIRKLDECCVQAIRWLEADWDRNRFADDPYKADLNRTDQHLLDRFRRMHAFHEQFLIRN
jgi:hypothetical protein